MILKFYIWLMGVAGSISAWAWRKHVKMIESKRQKEDEEYLEELKKKL